MLRIFSVLLVLFMVSACQQGLKNDSQISGDASESVDSYNDISNQLETFAPIPGDDMGARAADRVFFAFDSAALSSSARNTLDRQISWLKSNNSQNVTVEGHCDERGTREYNLALGERRAIAVKSYLVNNGISSSRIKTVSYGKERPAVIGSNPNAWSLNRRSVTVLVD